MVSKLDFEKAYYRVSWDFLDNVLSRKGFGGKMEEMDEGMFVDGVFCFSEWGIKYVVLRL